MDILKLVKLMYLADRESMEAYGFPITGDRMVSMPHGPVLSQTYDHIKGGLESCPDGWDAWVADLERKRVSLKQREDQDLDELSRADEGILESVWNRFGAMTGWELRAFTHDNCAEWVDPRGSSSAISYARVFEVLGLSPEQAERAAVRIEDQDRIDGVFASL